MKKNHSSTWQPILFLSLFLFSFTLMLHTFSYADGQIHMARTVWSDFGSHIPLIRSFSMGDNLDFILRGKPPEYPLFPGEPIRYHYVFYLLVGLLEKAGMRIDWALNIPSSLGFFLLLLMILLVAKELFGDLRVGVLAIIFFLFNGSLSFLQFLQKYPLSLYTPMNIWQASEFPAFAPWGPGDISAFWNLNIYTNQRHLALAFGIVLAFIYCCLHLERMTKKTTSPFSILKFQLSTIHSPLSTQSFFFSLLFGFLFGLFPLFHQPSLLILAIFVALYFLLFSRLRVFLVFTSFFAAVVAYVSFQFIGKEPSRITWHPWYLMTEPKTWLHFFSYWWQNIGLHIVLIPIGYIISPMRVKKAFLPLIPLFIFPNIYQFAREAAASHKFFNFFLLFGQILSAHTIVVAMDWIQRRKDRTLGIFPKILGLACISVVLLFATLSGVIDFFVIKNDRGGDLADIPRNEAARWIAQNTPRDAVILNSSFLYHPASIAGRKVFLGWPYFAWSAGQDTTKRLQEMKTLYESSNALVVCKLIANHRLSYATLHAPPLMQEVTFPKTLPSNIFVQIYQTTDKTVSITTSHCTL